MKTIEEIIYKSSVDTPDGLEINYKEIHRVIQELKDYTKDCTLHMLKYCFNNVGNKDVNVGKEIEKFLRGDLKD